MASSTLASTKRRINSVRSTLKITSAMKVVATSRLKTYRDKLGSGGFYLEKLKEILAKVIANLDVDDKDNINNYARGDKQLILVVSSSLGLCGAYNNNIFKVFHEVSCPGDDVLVIGHKMAGHLSFSGVEYSNQFVDAFHGFDYSVSREIGNTLLKKFKSGEYGKVILVATEYQNSIKFRAYSRVIFPVEIEKKGLETYAKIEPNANMVYNELLPQYINSTIYNLLLSSVVAEYTSRRNAMENASDNAEDIIADLELQYNKARQAAITQEITEIVSGANAAK